jgi:hypothetical protein
LAGDASRPLCRAIFIAAQAVSAGGSLVAVLSIFGVLRQKAMYSNGLPVKKTIATRLLDLWAYTANMAAYAHT